MSKDIQNNINALIESRKSILISSLNNENLPEISSTPFLQIASKFYIFISELASHTENIRQHPKISIMLIEDEQDTKNTFARKRLSYVCEASIIDRQHPSWESIIEQFEIKHGNTINLLKQLQDFHLFELKLISGNYIEGFGKAFHLSGENLKIIEQQTKSSSKI